MQMSSAGLWQCSRFGSVCGLGRSGVGANAAYRSAMTTTFNVAPPLNSHLKTLSIPSLGRYRRIQKILLGGKGVCAPSGGAGGRAPAGGSLGLPQKLEYKCILCNDKSVFVYTEM